MVISKTGAVKIHFIHILALSAFLIIGMMTASAQEPDLETKIFPKVLKPQEHQDIFKILSEKAKNNCRIKY